jgi:hypothetical protein
MARDGLAAADRPDVLSRLGLDIEGRPRQPEQLGKVGPNGRLVRAEPGFLSVNDHVAIDDMPAILMQAVDNFGQQLGTVEPAPFWIGIGIMIADVSQTGGAQQGVGHGMTDNVGIGVSCQPMGMFDPQPSQDQRPSFHQSMRVVPDPYSQFRAPSVLG